VLFARGVIVVVVVEAALRMEDAGKEAEVVMES
jgi:hypothetical protein